MTEPLFGVRPSMTGRLRFDLPIQGPDVSVGDHERLTGLLGRVGRYMEVTGRWVTLAELSAACNGAEASVSARLRDLRKRGWEVERRKTDRPGIFEYRAARPESKWRSA